MKWGLVRVQKQTLEPRWLNGWDWPFSVSELIMPNVSNQGHLRPQNDLYDVKTPDKS